MTLDLASSRELQSLWALVVEEPRLAGRGLYRRLKSEARSGLVSGAAVLVGAGGGREWVQATAALQPLYERT